MFCISYWPVDLISQEVCAMFTPWLWQSSDIHATVYAEGHSFASFQRVEINSIWFLILT